HVDHCDARDLVGRWIEKRILHTERAQDPIADEVLIFFSGTHLDQPPKNLYTWAAVAPLRTRLEKKRLLGELPYHFIQGHVHQLRIVVDRWGSGVLNARCAGDKIA